MNDDLDFPALETFKELEQLIYPARKHPPPGALVGFEDSINVAFDRLGFTEPFVKRKMLEFKQRGFSKDDVERRAFLPSKVVKDIIWGMINLDEITVDVLDTPIVQRLRHIRQNGFTYLVFPSASHNRLEHSLGVLAVASRYIESINASVGHSPRFAEGLVPKLISSALALDIKHAALLHDIGHFPYSHVLETIFEAAASEFSIGATPIRDFEISYMKKLINTKSHLSEKLSVAIVLSPRFREFYTALREDPWAYLRVACLISGTPLDNNTPGYSQLISGAVDCDKVDYLLRDSAMCNVPVAIDQARLFLSSTLVECDKNTIQKLTSRGVLGLGAADLDRPALILVLNNSGVDTIEEVAFARATLYERVYRHAVTRNAERVLAVAIVDAATSRGKGNIWRDAMAAFCLTDDTFLMKLTEIGTGASKTFAAKLRSRILPKRAFAFSPDFYKPIVPYLSILQGRREGDGESTYYHDVTTKEPFHEIVQSLKEGSPLLSSSETHREIEKLIARRCTELAQRLRKLGESNLPAIKAPEVFFIPLPDHSSTPSSCAIVTREGELESSGDYSRAHQLVSAKEIGRSVGFVTCDSDWAEIAFLASQEVLYDYFGDEIGEMDLLLDENEHWEEYEENEAQKSVRSGKGQRVAKGKIQVGVIKRFYITDELAARRCRVSRPRLRSFRRKLSKTDYYNKRPRLAEPEPRTSNTLRIADKFKEFSGQYGWRVTQDTVLHYINQFPPPLRSEVKKWLETIKFLDRHKTNSLLKKALSGILSSLDDKLDTRAVRHIVPLAGTSAHMALELLKQESHEYLKQPAIRLSQSVHETLGIARAGDAIVFIDDNIGSGTQFSAQLLEWMGKRNTAKNENVRKEKGIEFATLDRNPAELLAQLDIWLATCVGATDSESRTQANVQETGLKVGGVRFGATLNDSYSQNADTTSDLIKHLAHVGAECMRHTRGLSKVTQECRANSLGYGNLRGATVTLWNVPTSTFTALWSPGIVDGEPWCPLFVRRGYVEKLVVG